MVERGPLEDYWAVILCVLRRISLSYDKLNTEKGLRKSDSDLLVDKLTWEWMGQYFVLSAKQMFITLKVIDTYNDGICQGFKEDKYLYHLKFKWSF